MAGISITLAGNFSKLDELNDKAHKTAKSIKSAFQSNVGKWMFAGVAAGATAAFAGVVAAVKQAVDAGGELNDMMARTGAAGKGLVVMQRAFENAGLAASQVPQALNRMQKALAGVNDEGQPTNEAFTKLGLSIAELMALDPVDAFQRTAEAISSIQNPAQRTAIAMEMFGKSGGEMLAVLTDPAAFSQAAQQVGSLGDTLADNAAALDAVGDAFGSLDVKVQQIGAEVAVALLPQLEQLSDWLNETDFAAVGGGVGILVEKLATLGSTLAEISQYMPLMIALNKLSEMSVGGAITPEELAKAKAEADANVGRDVNPNSVAGQQKKSDTATQVQAEAASAAGAKKRQADADKAAKDAERAAKAAEKKAEADAKAAAEKEKTRAAAISEYNLDARILAARIAGDSVRLAALEREKKIREEIKRLEGAGFTAAEARRPAEAKVDAEKKATEAEKKAQEHKEHLQRYKAGLESRLDDVRGKQSGLQYESSVGAISSMQRIGGGGGAVASGLDYARQQADLQREANNLLRELLSNSLRDVET